MSDQKPREFWIEGNPISIGLHIAANHPFKGTPVCEAIHVIEKSAYDELQEKLRIATETLKSYQQTQIGYAATIALEKIGVK